MKASYLIEIPRRALFCALEKEPFTPGMEYFSVLEELEMQGLTRKDYCAACWERISAELLNKVVSHWKSKVPAKKVAEAEPLDKTEQALELLKNALASSDPVDQEEAFVLALFLARGRKLLLRQDIRRDDGSSVSLYEVAATEEMLAVKKISLSTLQTEKIQASLALKFRQA